MATAAYIGDTEEVSHGTPGGVFYNGVPARDLTDEDYDELSDEHQALVDTGEIYVVTP